MHNDTHNPHDSAHPEPRQDRLPDAALIRCAADGELNATGKARFDAIAADRPEVGAQVAFEQGLRGACSRVMADAVATSDSSAEHATRCPDALRACIEAIAATSAETTDAANAARSARQHDAEHANDEQLAERLATRAAETRTASFWTNPRRVVPVAALAATLVMLLSVTAVLIERSTTEPIPTAATLAGGIDPAYRTRLASFVSGEHNRCRLNSEAAARKFSKLSQDELNAFFTKRLGAMPDLPDCSSIAGVHVTSLGVGPCKVPGADGRSAHLMFQAAYDSGAVENISLFIMPDTGVIPLPDEQVYEIDTAACGVADSRVVAQRHGDVIYLVVSAPADECPTGGGCGLMLTAMGAGKPVGTL